MAENDPYNEEPREQLPRLTLGEYVATVSRVENADTFNHGKMLFVELSIDSAKGDEAVPAGTLTKIVIPIDVKKSAIPFMVKRVKGFVYPCIGRRNVPWDEVLSMLDDPSLFVGKKLLVSVAKQLDKDGNVKTNDEGVAWTETSFRAAA